MLHGVDTELNYWENVPFTKLPHTIQSLEIKEKLCYIMINNNAFLFL